MPALGYGTWQVSNNISKILLLLSLSNLLKAQDDVMEKSLNIALEIGYRHIDTAFIYGNEAVIGRVLNRWISSGKIKRIISIFHKLNLLLTKTNSRGRIVYNYKTSNIW